MAFEILEYAANVRQKRVEIDAKITTLRHKGYEWTQYSIASQEVMRTAEVALSTMFDMLTIIHRLASEHEKNEERHSDDIRNLESQVSAQALCIEKYEQDMLRDDV